MPLDKLLVKLQQNKISLADAIVEALPELRKIESDATLAWLGNELQGYRDALTFYYQSNHGLPEYRVVSGSLKLFSDDGKVGNLNHELASRDKYFLSAPIAWLEEFAGLPGDVSMTDMLELTDQLKSGQVVLQLPKTELMRILKEVKDRLLKLVTQHCETSGANLAN